MSHYVIIVDIQFTLAPAFTLLRFPLRQPLRQSCWAPNMHGTAPAELQIHELVERGQTYRLELWLADWGTAAGPTMQRPFEVGQALFIGTYPYVEAQGRVVAATPPSNSRWQ